MTKKITFSGLKYPQYRIYIYCIPGNTWVEKKLHLFIVPKCPCRTVRDFEFSLYSKFNTIFTKSLTDSQWPAACGDDNVYSTMSVALFDENGCVRVLRQPTAIITFATVVMNDSACVSRHLSSLVLHTHPVRLITVTGKKGNFTIWALLYGKTKTSTNLVFRQVGD